MFALIRSCFVALFMLGAVCAVQAQLVDVFHEVFYEDDGSVVGYPAGCVTYRIYARTQDPTDAVYSIYGVGANALVIGSNVPNGIWNSGFGGVTGPDLNAAFFSFFPQTQYDSMVTIGRASNADPGGTITVAESAFENSLAVAFGTAAPSDEWDNNAIVLDGTWFGTPADVNTYGVTPDNLILLAQITTFGDLFYSLNLQMNDEGIGGQVLQYVWDPTAVGEGQFYEPSLQYPTILEISGCMDPSFCNYDPEATTDDGSCSGVAGCDLPEACNYVENPDCVVACLYEGDVCSDGNPETINDVYTADCGCEGEPIVYGCTYEGACNYDPEANFFDGSCAYVYGCTDESACNFNTWAGCDDGSCLYGTTGCLEFGACNYDPDAVCFETCTYPGCTDPAACNWNPAAGCDDGSCILDFTPGCPDPLACNYVESAMCDDAACVYPGCTDPYACNYDLYAGCDDGSCEGIQGCTDDSACNYDSNATCDNGQCEYPGCMDPDSCEYDPDAGCDDGSCTGGGSCNDPAACNYDAGASCDSGCLYPGCLDPLASNFDPYADCEGPCVLVGCMDPQACNFNLEATQSDPTACTYPGCTDMNACNFTPGAGCDDGSCVGQVDCTDPAACNYTPEPTGECDEVCYYPGCNDLNACNYEWDAGCNDGSCEYGTHIQLWFDQDGDAFWDQVGFEAEGVFGSQGSWSIPELGVTLYADMEGRIDLPSSAPPGIYYMQYNDPAGVFYPSDLTQLVLELPLCSNKTIGVTSNGEIAAASQTPCCIWLWNVNCVNGFNPGLFVENQGTVPLNGTVTVTTEYPMEAEYLWGAIPYDNATENEVTWDLVNLLPGLGGNYQCHLNPPLELELGTVIHITLNLTLYNNDGEVWYSETIVLDPQLVCGYDPNDKYAVPEGYAAPHFVPQEDEIEYRIRFQNTGNALAIDVRIEDQLDTEHLDLDSFYPVFGSHDFTTCLEDNGKVTFKFNNILLPDSATDEPGSQGYVVYRIRPLPDLPHGTEINNTAEIYFDINDPIITNTTWHTIMDCEDFAQMEVSDAPLCAGTEVLLETGTPEYVDEYYWFWTGEEIGTESSGSYAPDTDGTFYLEHQVINPICNETVGQNMEVLPLPAYTLNAAAPCLGDDFEPTVDTDETFQWEGQEPGQDLSVSLDETTSFSLSVLGANGCEQSETLEISPLPLPTYTVSAPDPCEGTPLQSNVNTDGTFQWEGYEVGEELNETLTEATEFTLTVTGENGCESGETLSAAPLPNPTPGFIQNGTYCPGSILTITEPNLEVNWEQYGEVNPLEIEITGDETLDYAVTGDNGCSTEGSLSITALSAPEANFLQDGSYCPGATLTITEPDLDIDWEEYGAVNPLEIEITGDENLNYTVTDDNGCSSEGSLSITALNAPEDTFTQDGALLTANEGIAWQWYFNDVAIDGATEQTYEATENGAYHVVVTNDEGCSTTGAAVDIIVISVGELEVQTLVYPNPSSTHVVFEFDQMLQTNYRLIDALGRTVRQGTLNSNRLELSVVDLAAGNYALQLMDDTHVPAIPVVVRH